MLIDYMRALIDRRQSAGSTPLLEKRAKTFRNNLDATYLKIERREDCLSSGTMKRIAELKIDRALFYQLRESEIKRISKHQGLTDEGRESLILLAQNSTVYRITYKDGSVKDLKINEIDKALTTRIAAVNRNRYHNHALLRCRLTSYLKAVNNRPDEQTIFVEMQSRPNIIEHCALFTQIANTEFKTNSKMRR